MDFDAFRSLFSDVIVEGNTERYQFTWPDKKKAKALANLQVTSTLRPCREDSVNFDTTENLYIEGDNLEVLKLLQETYLGKIKMIYIDPPYNTGNDFVYEDDFSQNTSEYASNSGQYDNQGNRLVANTESNGRFHTDWLNMMYPRLKLAKDLLSDDGAIFISIGDDEEANLIKICDEIFGEQNFIASICHKHRASVSNDRIISENHNHIVFYARNINTLFANHKEIGDDPDLSGFDHVDEKGEYKLTPVDGPGGAKKGNPFYEFKGVSGYWRYSKETMQKKFDEGLIVVTQNNLQQKYYKSQAEKSRKTLTTWWDDYYTSTATTLLKGLMGSIVFDSPKHPDLIERMVKMIAKFDSSAIILDFFSGSATTAHAAMKLNAEDGGHRKFIMVQLPEKCDEKSEAYKAGYKNICEIGKERIRRAGKQILDELKEKNGELFADDNSLDIGFRCLKLDTSNMEEVYYAPEDTDQGMLDNLLSNIKKDRTDEDLLFQVMLDLGVLLSAKIKEEMVAGKKVFNVDNNYLVACFDEDVNEDVIIEVAKKKPTYFVMRDSSLANDSVSVNFDQIFSRYSPDTIRKVL